MRDELAITSLIQELRAEGVGDKLQSLFREAEQLRRQTRIGHSIDRAKDALRLAQSNSSAVATGIAFLHLAVARHASRTQEDYVQAIADCDTAAAWLERSKHNYFIAQAIQARLLQEEGQWQRAIERYLRAIAILDDLIENHNRRGETDVADHYERWRTSVQAYVKQIEAPRLSAKPSIPPDETQPSQPGLSPPSTTPLDSPDEPVRASTADVAVETPLATPVEAQAQPVPATELFAAPSIRFPIEWPTIPVLNAFVHAGEPEDAFGHSLEHDAEECLKIQFLLKGQPYSLRPSDPKVTGDSIVLSRNHQYLALEIQGDSMEPMINDGDFVLVRRQDQHDHNNQIVVVNTGEQPTPGAARNIVRIIREDPAGVQLVPANPKYSAQKLVDTETPHQILGVVIGILSPLV